MSEIEGCVIDTSVLVSRLLFRRSVPALAATKALFNFQLIASTETLDELRGVLMRPKFDPFLPLADRMDFCLSVQAAAVIIPSVIPISACRDPKDDKFLSLAVTGKAKFILTGDRDLLALHPFRGIDIVTPRQFLELYA